MIDEDRTLQLYGYTSDELSPKSAKTVVAVCEECGKYRDVKKSQYHDLCLSCTRQTDEYRHNRSLAARNMTKEHRNKLSQAALTRSDDTRRRLSAAQQGIPYEEWESFSSDGKYCHKFDNSCREHNRDKYDRLCFICGKNEVDNGERLCVHHCDMDKKQGCGGVKWKLVPLCKSCHARAHTPMWQTRIAYLITHNL